MSASFAYRRLSYLGMPVLLRHSWPHGEKDRVRDLIFVTATCVWWWLWVPIELRSFRNGAPALCILTPPLGADG